MLKRCHLLRVVAALLFVTGARAHAELELKFTTDALGLGSTKLNGGSVVSDDIAGKFITSPTTGQGSLLYIQANGAAGQSNLLVTISAQTRLDVTSGVPAGSDYQAGVLSITSNSSASPDGRNEGLGVRAFTVDDAGKTSKGLRTYDSKGRARIEGNEEVYGGTADSAFDQKNPNSTAEVDELIRFDFSAGYNVVGSTVSLLLSSFETTDRLNLKLYLDGGGTLTYNFMGPAGDGMNQGQFTNLGSDVRQLALAGLTGLGTSILRGLTISAVDDNPSHPSGSAEKFRVAGMRLTPASVSAVVPEPSTVAMAGIALLSGAALRWKRRRRHVTLKA